MEMDPKPILTTTNNWSKFLDIYQCKTILSFSMNDCFGKISTYSSCKPCSKGWVLVCICVRREVAVFGYGCEGNSINMLDQLARSWEVSILTFFNLVYKDASRRNKLVWIHLIFLVIEGSRMRKNHTANNRVQWILPYVNQFVLQVINSLLTRNSLSH